MPEEWEGYDLDHLGAPNPDNVLSVYTVGNPKSFVLYPNPTKGIIHISGKESVDAIRLINISGQLIMEATNAKTLDLSSQLSGLYLIEIENEGRTTTGKLIKR